MLHASRWQESSKIVQLFSADYGYIKIIARGAFRPKSPFRGTLEALNYIEAIISSKETRGLQILTSATLLDSYMNIREDLEKTAAAFSVLEMLKKLFSVHEPVKPFFQYIIELFSALNSPGAGEAPVYLSHFLLQLSNTLGFGWTFGSCLSCKKPPEKFPALLDHQNGGIICGNCRGRFPASGTELSQKEWEQILKLSGARTASLPEAAQPGQQKFIASLVDMLLKHIAYHSESALELKSLKWYV